MAPKTPNAKSRVIAAFDAARHRTAKAVICRGLLGYRWTPPRSFFGLLVSMALFAAPTASNALDPTIPKADPPVSEGCCGTEDQDYTFRGYTIELWDEAPTISEPDCPNQDEACLLNEADRISRVYHLQEALVSRADFWRAQHFGKGPFIAGAFSTQ